MALGGEVEDVTDDTGPEPRRLAREATTVLGLGLAGVDLMSIDGAWYILEVDAAAGFGGPYSATGTTVAPRIAQLAVEHAGGTVEGSRIRELESTLDDSVPECKPPLADVGLSLNGSRRAVTASITDRSEMTYPTLLGRDVLEVYTLDIGRAVGE